MTVYYLTVSNYYYCMYLVCLRHTMSGVDTIILLLLDYRLLLLLYRAIQPPQ